MISDDDVMRLFEQADPARRPDRANDHVAGAGYLAALREQRSIDMTITETPQTPAQSSRPRHWALIGAAAAVAALTIGLVAVVAQDNEPPPPADPAPAPITSPSEVEEVDIAEQFYAALNDRDLATLQTLMGDDGVYDGIPVEDMPAHLTALEAWDWTWKEVACEPEPADAGVRCEIAVRNRLTELTGTELSGSSLFTMIDGTIDRVDLDQLDFSDYSPNAFMPFQTWVSENHPDDYQTIWEENDSFRQTPESAALLDQHLTEYIREFRSEPEQGQPRVTPLLSGQPQQTVVGDITWTRIDGTSLPTSVFAGVDGGFIGLNPQDNVGTVWQSADGIEWEELTGPRVPDEELFIDDTEELTPADPPPSAAPEHQYVVFDGGLMALSPVPDESRDGWGLAGVELWTQADGTETWEPVEVPVPSGAQIDAAHISSNGSQVLFSIVSSDSPGANDPQRYEAWSTTDGTTWQVVDLDASDGLVYWPPESTDFGWMADEPDARPRGISVSADGLTWQNIPYSDLTDSMPGGMSILATAAGRTIFAISADSRVMLVGQVADQ